MRVNFDEEKYLSFRYRNQSQQCDLGLLQLHTALVLWQTCFSAIKAAA